MRTLLLAVALLTACASNRPKPDESTYCPESRNQVCMTQRLCSFNKERACFVCQCSSGENVPMRPADSPVPTTNGTLPQK